MWTRRPKSSGAKRLCEGSVDFDDFCELLDFEDMPDDVLQKCPSPPHVLFLRCFRYNSDD